MVYSCATKLLGSFAPILFAPRGFKVANFNMGKFFKMVVETWNFFYKMQIVIVNKKVNHDLFLGHVVWPPFWMLMIFPDFGPHAPLKTICSEDTSSKWMKLCNSVIKIILHNMTLSDFKHLQYFFHNKSSKKCNFWFSQFLKGHNSGIFVSIENLMTSMCAAL